GHTPRSGPSGRHPLGFFDIGGADEPVAGARDRLDVPRLVPVVLKLGPQGSHVTVHDVALDHEVSAPERVEDLFACKDAARVCCEEVEQRLLERGQMQLVFAREDLSVENVDLEVTDAQPREQLSGAAMCPTDHRARPRDKVVTPEWDADVIVGATLEGVELPTKVATPGERDHAHRPVVSRFVDELDPGTG